MPCRNNGTCQRDLALKLGYQCLCDKLYYGEHCEVKRSVCMQEKCSGHGHCHDENGEAVCECYTSYSGNQQQKKFDFQKG